VQDQMNLDAVRDIHRIFSEINRIKAVHAELPNMKIQYADLVNELMSITVENSETGEELAAQALQLGEAIQQAMSAKQHIQRLEQELITKYGFLRSTAAA
jgi:regulator of replication initiation timing